MNKENKTVAAIAVFAIVLLAWMFRFEYSTVDMGAPGSPSYLKIRTDRFTGTVEFLAGLNWVAFHQNTVNNSSIVAPNTPKSAPAAPPTTVTPTTSQPTVIYNGKVLSLDIQAKIIAAHGLDPNQYQMSPDGTRMILKSALAVPQQTQASILGNEPIVTDKDFQSH